VKDKQIHIKLPAKLHALVERQASEEGVTVTAVVTALLTKWATGLVDTDIVFGGSK
jgi:hypothetical protein